MGSHNRKKKVTQNTNVLVHVLKTDAEQDQTRLALQPTFEGTTYTVPIINTIDFVSVTDSVDPSQG